MTTPPVTVVPPPLPGPAAPREEAGPGQAGSHRRRPEARQRVALVVEPDHADARNNLGVVLAELGRTAEAAARFREALRLAPGHAGARRNLERLGVVLP